MFRGADELRHVLHDEYRSAGAADDIKKRAPEVLARVVHTISVQQTKPLARGAPNHHVRSGNIHSLLKELDDVPRNCMVAEVGVEGRNGRGIHIVGPNRLNPKSLSVAKPSVIPPAPQKRSITR